MGPGSHAGINQLLYLQFWGLLEWQEISVGRDLEIWSAVKSPLIPVK